MSFKSFVLLVESKMLDDKLKFLLLKMYQTARKVPTAMLFLCEGAELIEGIDCMLVLFAALVAAHHAPPLR